MLSPTGSWRLFPRRCSASQKISDFRRGHELTIGRHYFLVIRRHMPAKLIPGPVTVRIKRGFGCLGRDAIGHPQRYLAAWIVDAE
jgi:hypothetical protein